MSQDQFTHLLRKDPRNGRMIKENGNYFNEANYLSALGLENPSLNVLKQRTFFWQHLREEIPSANEHYYAFVMPADKYVLVYTRLLESGQGPVRLESVVGATFDNGTPISPVNLFTGGPAAETTMDSGVINVVGGTVIPNDFLFGAGNKVGVAGGSLAPTIVPPGVTFLLKVTNEATGTNPGIRLALVFAEIPEGEILGL